SLIHNRVLTKSKCFFNKLLRHNHSHHSPAFRFKLLDLYIVLHIEGNCGTLGLVARLM
ncbi:hypothetical protein MTR67_021768, partial [Solanum verrucosum]